MNISYHFLVREDAPARINKRQWKFSKNDNGIIIVATDIHGDRLFD